MQNIYKNGILKSIGKGNRGIENNKWERDIKI